MLNLYGLVFRISSKSGFIILLIVLWGSNRAFAVDELIGNSLMFGQQGKYGHVKFDLRYRYENVHVANNLPTKTAYANTLRLRAGYLSPEFFELQAFIEYQGNLAMQEDYHSLDNGFSQYETVADPQAQELNQFWLSYKGIPDTLVKGGRQRIVLDNQRFIGNDNWRQLEQTFDAILIRNQSIENLTLNFIYIGQIQSVISVVQPVEMPLLNFSYQFGRYSTLTGYAYWLADYKKSVNSTQTYGVRMHGEPRLKHDIQLSYDIGYSNQASYKNNPAAYALDRYTILLGASYAGFTIKSGMEQLDGNGVYAFQTPLASKHNFQGWADKFLLTPEAGIRDIQASIDKSLYGIKFMFAYHNFSDSSGHEEYGNEYDLLITRQFGKHYQLLAKYAYYDADNNPAGVAASVEKDTQKIWIQGSVNF